MKKLMMAAFLLMFTGFLITGCNTVQGAGQDIQATGKAISNAAEKSK